MQSSRKINIYLIRKLDYHGNFETDSFVNALRHAISAVKKWLMLRYVRRVMYVTILHGGEVTRDGEGGGGGYIATIAFKFERGKSSGFAVWWEITKLNGLVDIVPL